MKKFIFCFLAIIALVACSKENLIPDAPTTSESFITINGMTINLDESRADIRIDYDEYNGFGYVEFEVGRILSFSNNTSNNVSTTTTTYDKMAIFCLEYDLESTNEKTDIRKVTGLEGAFIDGKQTKTIIETYGSQYIDQKFEPNQTINAVAFHFENCYGESVVINNEVIINDFEDADLFKDDFIENGWYLVEEVSTHKIRFSGELKTHNGITIKFSFPYKH